MATLTCPERKPKLPKPLTKVTKFKNKRFLKAIKKYGEKRTTPRSWEKDISMAGNEKTRKKLMEAVMTVLEEKHKEVEVKEEKIKEAIKIKLVDIHVGENSKAHHTDGYFACEETDEKGQKKDQKLVVRRGQEFTLTFVCDRKYEKENDGMQLVFATGINPSEVKETEAKLELDESRKEPTNTDYWNARLVAQKDKEITVNVVAPNDCIIGEWEMKVLTFIDNDDDDNMFCCEYEYPEDITIILNPWCKDDTCYMSNIDDLKEYVLNPNGCIYQGDKYDPYPKSWHFGQFDNGILEASLCILRKSFRGKVTKKLGNPVFISRAIAKEVNSFDDGVLAGNWSGNYEGGTNPSTWTGSAKILRKYAEEKRAIRYGQCWVFSGITTAVCRALGLPCRSVTTFSSAHDTDGNPTIDWIYELDEDDGTKEKTGGESVWNYHCWNEVWMARPDLPPGHDGWQVIDATPQEQSDGVYTCGPASVAAIKNGECTLQYDTAFIYAEVNADIRKWLKDGSSYELMEVVTDEVGKNISTKKVTGEDMETVGWFGQDPNREDITNHYKYPEGSKEERKSIKTANLKVDPNFYEKHVAKQKDLSVTLKDVKGVMIGQDVKLEIEVKHISKEKERRTMRKLVVRIFSCQYRGLADGKYIKQEHIAIDLKYGEVKTFTVILKFDEYWEHIHPSGNMMAVISGRCNETQRTHVFNHKFRIKRPDIEFKFPKSCKIGQEMPLEVIFKNPTPRKLTECKLTVDTCQLFKMLDDEDDDPYKDEILVEDIQPKGELHKVIRLKAIKQGFKPSIFLSFESKELTDIVGRVSCTIKKE